MDERGENEAFTINEITHDNQDDAASQSSQRSLGGRSTSLFERIQRQRELEATTTTTAAGIPPSTQTTTNGTTNSSTFPVPQQNLLPPAPPPQIHVPQYGPMPGFGNADGTLQPPPPPQGSTSVPQQGYLNNAWNSFTQSMESTRMADKSQLNSSPSYENDEMHHALLPPTSHYTSSGQSADEYSISQYFLTFVKDVYGLFIWLPIAVRIIVVAGLLYVVVKFI